MQQRSWYVHPFENDKFLLLPTVALHRGYEFSPFVSTFVPLGTQMLQSPMHEILESTLQGMRGRSWEILSFSTGPRFQLSIIL
jgi:hypothetical protein